MTPLAELEALLNLRLMCCQRFTRPDGSRYMLVSVTGHSTTTLEVWQIRNAALFNDWLVWARRAQGDTAEYDPLAPKQCRDALRLFHLVAESSPDCNLLLTPRMETES